MANLQPQSYIYSFILHYLLISNSISNNSSVLERIFYYFFQSIIHHSNELYTFTVIMIDIPKLAFYSSLYRFSVRKPFRAENLTFQLTYLRTHQYRIFSNYFFHLLSLCQNTFRTENFIIQLTHLHPHQYHAPNNHFFFNQSFTFTYL